LLIYYILIKQLVHEL